MRTAWWDEPKGQAHKSIWSSFRALDEEQYDRRMLDLRHLRLYSNRVYSGLTGNDWSIYEGGDRLKINVVKAVVNTAVAQIATNKIRSMFLTHKGDRAARNRGYKLGRFCVGTRKYLRQHIVDLSVFRDSMIFGSGFDNIWADPVDEIQSERVLGYDIIVDEQECREGDPRSMYRYKEVDPYLLIAIYGKRHEGDILRSSLGREQINPRSETLKSDHDPISVIETWRLPD